MAKEEKRGLLARLFTRGTKELLQEATTPTINQFNNSRDSVQAVSASSIKLNSTIDALNASEKQLMTLYDQMDQDGIISATLDLYADNATLVNPRTGHVAAIESGDNVFQEEVNDFLWNIFEVDTEAWEIVRDVAKYGKIFIDTKAVSGGQDWSFITVEDASRIQALVQGNNNTKYYAVAPEEPDLGNNPSIYQQIQQSKEQLSYTVEPKDRFISGFNSRQNLGKMVVEFNDPVYNRQATEELNIRTGRSALSSVVIAWQTLNTLEQALLTNRLTKATQFKIVEIDVSDTTNKEAKEILDNVKNSFKNSETIDQVSQRYQNRLAPITVDDLVFSLKRGEKGAVNVKPVGGELSEVPMNDVEHFRNKLFAGLGVPKAYLGFEETTPGGLGESVLTKLDERLGRRIVRYQQVLRYVLKQAITYYWTHSKLGRTEGNMPAYDLILGQVSTREQEETRNNLIANFNVANSIIGLAKTPEFEGLVDYNKMFKYIFEEVLSLDLAKIDTVIQPEDISLKVKDLTPKQIQEQIKARNKTMLRPLSSADTILEQYVVSGSLQNLLENKSLSELLDEYDIELVGTDYSITNLLDIVRLPRFKRILGEATYKELKDKSKSKDPARTAKSKKIVMRYTGIDEDNYITFVATAEDPAKNKKEGKPTSYNTKVALKDALDLIRKGEGMTDLQLMQQAVQGNIAVSCSCPAAKYWGQQYNGTKEGYSIDLNNIPPTQRIPTQPTCKHTLTMITVLPFWTNTIVRDLRAKGLLAGGKTKQAKVEKEDLVNLEEE